MAPKLSIVLPTYNGAKFLAQQVSSILMQDDPDFELLMVDDGSSDGTPAIAADLAARDARIRVISSTGNLGQNNRIANLLGEARGHYVAIADQDDLWAPNRNSLLFAAMNGKPMAFGCSELIDSEGKSRGRTLLEVLGVTPGSHVKLRALIQPMFSAHATIAERGVINVASLYNPLPFDWLMALDALFSRGLVYVEDAKVQHRIHGGNQVNSLKFNRSRFGSGHIRWALLFRRTLRQRFWLVLDYLGRSTILDSETRRMFARLAGRVQTVWLSEWRSLRNDGHLNETLQTALCPLTTNEDDRKWFVDEVGIMTRSALSPVMLREVGSRLMRR